MYPQSFPFARTTTIKSLALANESLAFCLRLKQIPFSSPVDLLFLGVLAFPWMQGKEANYPDSWMMGEGKSYKEAWGYGRAPLLYLRISPWDSMPGLTSQGMTTMITMVRKRKRTSLRMCRALLRWLWLAVILCSQDQRSLWGCPGRKGHKPVTCSLLLTGWEGSSEWGPLKCAPTPFPAQEMKQEEEAAACQYAPLAQGARKANHWRFTPSDQTLTLPGSS